MAAFGAPADRRGPGAPQGPSFPLALPSPDTLSKTFPSNGSPTLTAPFPAMTQHASFKSNASTGAKRNVLKRFERVELLKKRGDFKGKRVTGLRKTKPDA